MEYDSARLAREDDLAAVEWIGEAVTRPLPDKRGGPIFSHREIGFESPGERFRRAMASENAICVVGTYDDVVFGYSVCFVESLDNGNKLGRLHDFAVFPDARDAGIGEAMMDIIVERLTEIGAVGVDAWALPGDRATKNFFESFGLKARLLTAHREL